MVPVSVAAPAASELQYLDMLQLMSPLLPCQSIVLVSLAVHGLQPQRHF